MLIKELTLFQTPETTHSINKFLSCRLNLFLKGFYNGGMKFFPISLLALAPIIITLLCEAKATGNNTVTKERCNTSKKELRSVSKDLKRLTDLKKKNEGLFDKYKDDFKAKIKISSNLFIIRIRSKSLSLRKQFLKEKHLQLRCKGQNS